MLQEKTLADLRAIAQDLIEAFALTYSETELSMRDPLLRWLDYRNRVIDPRPRRTVPSNGFNDRVPAEALSALTSFTRVAQAGGDLNPYQSISIKRNDTSGRKPQMRTDGLWADWGIYHAHLTDTPPASDAEFSDRSKWLIFFLVSDDALGLIDVRHHDEPGIFQAIDLVEKAFRSWPQLAQKFECAMDEVSPEPDSSAFTVATLRKQGISSILLVDGKFYVPPGMGVTAGATAMRLTWARSHLLRNACALMQRAADPTGWLRASAAEKGIENPTFRLVVRQGGLGYEAGGIVWMLPDTPKESSAEFVVQDCILPPWAATKLEIWRAKNAPIVS